jgi:hypothetical protein
MTVHAENTLRGPSITQVLNPPLAVSAFETIGTECLIACQNCQIFDFVSARAAAVGTVAAY